MGVPLSTVKWRIHHGKKLLRAKVEAQTNEENKMEKETVKLLNVLRRIARARVTPPGQIRS
jgi:hypothetical protein